MTQYKYLRGSRDSREAVEFDITRRGQYFTTCVVDVDLLTCGIKAFPCGNGDDLKLSPEQRLEILEFVQAERKKITDSYPVKTLSGWEASGFRTFEDYCFPGDEVDDAMVEHFVNGVPPTLNRPACTQDGEEHNFVRGDDGFGRPTYITFHRVGPDRWKFDGYCFYGKNENQEHGQTRLERRIAEARKEAERSGV